MIKKLENYNLIKFSKKISVSQNFIKSYILVWLYLTINPLLEHERDPTSNGCDFSCFFLNCTRPVQFKNNNRSQKKRGRDHSRLMQHTTNVIQRRSESRYLEHRVLQLSTSLDPLLGQVKPSDHVGPTCQCRLNDPTQPSRRVSLAQHLYERHVAPNRMVLDKPTTDV